MADFSICERLLASAQFVRAGAHFADIGTDHAYLPIFLLKTGKISRAVCSDINEGPLLVAKKNALDAELSEKIDFVLTDGADALSEFGITDAAICGMGGELISDIVTRAEFFKRDKVRLILQPMSRQAHLRRTLTSLGYKILDEAYSSDSGKFYVTILAEYVGVSSSYDEFFYEFGALSEAKELSSSALGYLEGKKRALKKAIEGKKQGGEPCEREELLYSELLKHLGKSE